MSRWVALLRGINLGPHNRVSMPELRSLLGDRGYEDVATVVASGNVVLSAPGTEADVARDLRAIVKEGFGVDTPVVVRHADELRAVVADSPYPDAGGKELHVLFLEEPCPPEAARALGELDLAPESLIVSGREIYAHYVNGMRDSPMARALGRRLGVVATDRNWNTVLKLEALL